MIEIFVFPLAPTLNQIICTARSNLYSSAKKKPRWTGSIALLCMGRSNFTGEIWIEFVCQIKNFQKSYPDNVSIAAKFVMDQLVEGGIITDESLKFIMSPVLH